MRIEVNGEERVLEERCSLAALLEQLEVDPRTVAVELSGKVIPRSQFDRTEVGEGDRVEVVRFVQGG